MRRPPNKIKVSIYSQRCDKRSCHDFKPLEYFLSQVQEAARVAIQQNSRMLILPGHSLGFRTEFHQEYAGDPNPSYSEQAVKEGAKHLQAVADGSVCVKDFETTSC